jgi:nucleotide-binding universal stress UspA family protein
MFKHILLPTDGSELSNKAIKQAIDLAKALGAKITALNVRDDHHLHFRDEGFDISDVAALNKRLEATATARAKEILEAVRTAASEVGIECDAVASTSDAPYDAILKQAKNSGCDVIIMAAYGHKVLPGLLLGSETLGVLTHSTIPVLVCR